MSVSFGDIPVKLWIMDDSHGYMNYIEIVSIID